MAVGPLSKHGQLERVGLAPGTSLRVEVCSLPLVTSHHLVSGAPCQPGLWLLPWHFILGPQCSRRGAAAPGRQPLLGQELHPQRWLPLWAARSRTPSGLLMEAVA